MLLWSRMYLQRCFLPELKCPCIILIWPDHKPPVQRLPLYIVVKCRSRTYFCPQATADGNCQNLLDTLVFWQLIFMTIKKMLFTCSLGEQKWHTWPHAKIIKSWFVDSSFHHKQCVVFFWHRDFIHEMILIWADDFDDSLLIECWSWHCLVALNPLLMYSRSMSLHNWEQLGLHILVFVLPTGRMC